LRGKVAAALHWSLARPPPCACVRVPQAGGGGEAAGYLQLPVMRLTTLWRLPGMKSGMHSAPQLSWNCAPQQELGAARASGSYLKGVDSMMRAVSLNLATA
jgi:hypothetical protein